MDLPHVTVACFCEKVLEEKNGSLSVIRIADRVEYEIPDFPLPEGIKHGFPLTALIAVKSGPAKGKFKLSVVSESPSGKRVKGPIVDLEMEGGDHGKNFILNYVFGPAEDGLYWFDVLVDNERLTRIPLMLVSKIREHSARQAGSR
ncbi:MAG: DUF6941 family protein [Candidatus Acidiferrales bacterium]